MNLCENTNNNNYFINVVKNKIIYSGNITIQGCHELNCKLRKLESDYSTETKPIANDFYTVQPVPIELYITSTGGVVYSALSVVATIKTMSIPVHTIISGYVASAATLISVVGAKRYIQPYSTAMIHELRANFWGKYNELQDMRVNIDNLMNSIVDIYIKHTKLDETYLREHLKRDVDWSIEECIKYGIVDEVVKTMETL